MQICIPTGKQLEVSETIAALKIMAMPILLRVPGFGFLPDLELLVLSNNLLAGPVPPTLSSLSKMRALYIDDNFLTGDITTMFNSLPNLTLFYAEDNDLTGTLDDGFLEGHEKIQAIDLSTNRIGGAVPDHLFSLPDLIILDIMLPGLSGMDILTELRGQEKSVPVLMLSSP